MVVSPRIVAVALATATLLIASCTRVVDDARAVAGEDRSPVGGSDASQCEQVDAPLTTIPVQGDDEPVMKIPQPDGWERSTMMDSELIRFAMVNQTLVKDEFASNVVVTLESAPGSEDAGVVFDSQRDALESTFGASDLQVTEHTLCGLPAETVRYLTPVIGNVAPHPAIVVMAVLHTDTTTYAVSVTAQTTDPDSPAYQRDVETILTGFQLLPPSPS
jgi:hypothetical protein